MENKQRKLMQDVDEILKNSKTTLDVDEVFYLRNVKCRRLFLDTDVDADSMEDIKIAILYYNFDDKGLPVKDRKPIWLYICSSGGSVPDGFSLVDVIKASKTPIYTINMGYCDSMALPIFLVGHKRYSLKHAQFLIHDGTMCCIDSSNKAHDCVEFEKRYDEEVTKRTILEHSNLTEELYDSKKRVEWYFLANEAQEMGMVDEIVTDLDEIVGGEL